jgi:septum formation protein
VVKKYPNHLILAADTIVVCDQQILGKPKDEKDAFRMLRLLSSNTHQVITGVSILNKNEAIAFSEATTIIFRALSDEEINDYIIISKEPFDKAGAYAIQGRASVFVEKIVGDYDNVVGLPITRVIKELKKIW